MKKLVFSQNLDVLAASLAQELASSDFCLQKRWIVVPNAPVKQWLTLRLNPLVCCKIVSVEELLLPKDFSCPTPLEMVCLLYSALSDGDGSKTELAEHLAPLFASYGLYGRALFHKKGDWQLDLLQTLFDKTPFRLPCQLLPEKGPILEDPVHCFGFDFLPPIYWATLARFPKLSIYLFSPCVHFWEDLCTDWERRHLFLCWERRGASMPARKQLDAYLREAPPLLANLGKLGRETLKILDAFPFDLVEAYSPIENTSLLHSLQNSLLHFDLENTPIPLNPDDSIAIFRTGSSKMDEVKAIREAILQLATLHSIPFSEIALLAPDIHPYVSLIETLFAKVIPYRIFGADMTYKGSFFQGLQRLNALVRSEWSAERIIEWIETPSLYMRQQWDPEQIRLFVTWTRDIMQSADWKKGLETWVSRLTMFSEREIPLSLSDHAEIFLSFLLSLEKDLMPLKTATLRLGAWADRWETLVDKYLTCDPTEEAWNTFRRVLTDLRRADARCGEATYPFELIESYLRRPSSGMIHGHELHAVQIGSMEPGAILPVRALFLMGMDEESFPRKKMACSLDLLQTDPSYVPTPPDIDRYLFLQSLFAAKDFFKITYGHLSKEEGKPVNPSLLVQELLRSLPAAKTLCRTVVSPSDRRAGIPIHFSLRCPLATTPKERVISLSDLIAFSRHPWKHFLQKTQGIYLEDHSEKTFAMQRAIHLRASFKGRAQELDLPQGPFKEAFALDLEERTSRWKEQLEQWGSPLLSLSFLMSVEAKRPRAAGKIEFPPLECEVEGEKVLVVGDVQEAIEQGALHLGDDSLPSVLKAWPALLATSVALNTTRIHFLKSGKIKQIAEPQQALQAFVSYYCRCAGALSPLLPDWADAFLRKGPAAFCKETQYEDPTVQWVLARLDMGETESLFTEWQWLKEAFSALIALYPTRAPNGVNLRGSAP